MKQKQALLSQFKEARQNNKTKWKIVDNEHCLFVDGTKVCASQMKNKLHFGFQNRLESFYQCNLFWMLLYLKPTSVVTNAQSID